MHLLPQFTFHSPKERGNESCLEDCVTLCIILLQCLSHFVCFFNLQRIETFLRWNMHLSLTLNNLFIDEEHPIVLISYILQQLVILRDTPIEIGLEQISTSSWIIKCIFNLMIYCWVCYLPPWKVVAARITLFYGFNLLNGVMLKICIEICGRTTSDTCYVWTA